MPEFTSCAGRDVLADPPFLNGAARCDGCGQWIDVYDDYLVGRKVQRFVPHVRVYELPGEFIEELKAG